MNSSRKINRREALRAGAAATAFMFLARPLSALGAAQAKGEVIPFLDAQPPGRAMLRWQELDSWVTPNSNVFAVSHYGTPKGDLSKYALEVTGLVKKPITLTLDEIKSRRKKEVIATLECSGNGSNPGFMGAIGNVRWTGTPLGPLLKERAPLSRAIEAVFFGADEMNEKIRDKEYTQQFARALSVGDAMKDDVILAWEMNGEPLTKDHGAPLRLVVPGWFGIAWVKWLTRIELLDRRYMSKYMAREYVTIRGEERNGKTIWRETSVGPIDTKSIIARAERLPNGRVRLTGAAWTDGTPLQRVEVQIRRGNKSQPGDRWQPAELDKARAKYAWRFFHLDWDAKEKGEFYVVSRAVDAEGRVQPAADDPEMQMKRTYWEANQQWPRKIRIEAAA
jgi:DMSO/TMAO reductase YedYZ molybdopterin-dependent catalytic subunit